MSYAGRLRWAFNAHVWQPTEKDWLHAASLIQLEEKARIGRFRFVSDAKLAMAGRLLIHAAVRATLALPNSAISLRRTHEGKPYLHLPRSDSQEREELQHQQHQQHQHEVLLSESLPNFNFNVSHAGDYVVLAAEPYQLVGVDVANMRPPLSSDAEEFFRLMTPQFTTNEWLHIRSPPREEDRLLEFYRYWALKESYIKAIGIGLGFDLQRLSFTSDAALDKTRPFSVCTHGRLSIDGNPPSRDWRFEQSHLDAEHCVAVALGPPAESIQSYRDTLPHPDPLPESEIPPYAPQPFSVLSFDQLTADLEPLRPPEDPEYAATFHSMRVKAR